jgi:hypothetical protein
VCILNSDGDTAPDYGSPFAANADGYAPDTADPGKASTWPAITEFQVANDGVRRCHTPQTVLASFETASGAASHSWNGPSQIVEVVLYYPNCAPIVGDIIGPQDPVARGTVIGVSAGFTDADANDTHRAVWDWGDGSSDTVDPAESPVSGSHTYGVPGVYTVTLTVTDMAEASDQSCYQYVVVYDAQGGFVTGGGWIMSPEGAYAPDPLLTGKANFGFVAKYKKGATTPDGETEFRFKAGDLNFHSTEYQWLVVAGPQAKFKGDGTVNGEGGYGFMLTARDGEVSGGGGTDRFRIKIWDKDSEQVVYDNQMGDADDADAATEIGGGSIVIHGE